MIANEEKYTEWKRIANLFRWLFIIVSLFSIPVYSFKDPTKVGKIEFLILFYTLESALNYGLVCKFGSQEKKRYWLGIVQCLIDVVAILLLTVLLKTPLIGSLLYVLLLINVFMIYLHSATTYTLTGLIIFGIVMLPVIAKEDITTFNVEYSGLILLTIVAIVSSLYSWIKEYEKMNHLTDMHLLEIEELERKADQLTILGEVISHLQHSNTLEKITVTLLFSIVETIKEKNISIMLYGENGIESDTKLYYYKDVKHAVLEGTEGIPFRLVYIDKILAELRKEREYKNCVQYFEPFQLDNEICPHEFKQLLDKDGEIERYVYLFPIMKQNKESGILICNTKNRIGMDICRYIGNVTKQGAMALERVSMLTEERKKTMQDSLTGVKSRLGLVKSMPHYLMLRKKHGYNTSCIFIDIDHFKSFNDVYGHCIGDEVLKIVANIIQNNIRSEDLVSRYGGEEFLVFLENVTQEEAYKKAETIRKKIEAYSLVEELSVTRRVTASFGIAMYPEDHEDFNKVIELSDKAMYKAKEQRNKVCIFATDCEKNEEEEKIG